MHHCYRQPFIKCQPCVLLPYNIYFRILRFTTIGFSYGIGLVKKSFFSVQKIPRFWLWQSRDPGLRKTSGIAIPTAQYAAIIIWRESK